MGQVSIKVTENGIIQKNGYGFLFTFYATMPVSCIASKLKQDIGRKQRLFHTPWYPMPPLGGPYRNIAIMFGVDKLEWHGYKTAKKV